VCLAERQSDGRAALHYVVEIRIDGEEVHFLAEAVFGICSTQDEPMNALTMQRWFENQPPWCVTAPWYGVIRAAEIEGGGTIRSNDPIIATYWPPKRNELWLLIGPREEWLTTQNEIKVPEKGV
jgi:hypothetical protein